MALGSTQPLTEMSARVSCWWVMEACVYGLSSLPHARADGLEIVGASISWNPKGLYREFSFTTVCVCIFFIRRCSY